MTEGMASVVTWGIALVCMASGAWLDHKFPGNIDRAAKRFWR